MAKLYRKTVSVELHNHPISPITYSGWIKSPKVDINRNAKIDIGYPFWENIITPRILNMYNRNIDTSAVRRESMRN